MGAGQHIAGQHINVAIYDLTRFSISTYCAGPSVISFWSQVLNSFCIGRAGMSSVARGTSQLTIIWLGLLLAPSDTSSIEDKGFDPLIDGFDSNSKSSCWPWMSQYRPEDPALNNCKNASLCLRCCFKPDRSNDCSACCELMLLAPPSSPDTTEVIPVTIKKANSIGREHFPVAILRWFARRILGFRKEVPIR